MTTTTTNALPPDIARLLDVASDHYGLPRVYARAVAWVESKGDQTAVGRRGELGVMQLLPSTAQTLGVDPRSLTGNVDGGVRHLAALVRRYGERVGIAAYNAGEGRVKNRLPSAWPETTRRYVEQVIDRSDYEGRTMGLRTAEGPFADELTANMTAGPSSSCSSSASASLPRTQEVARDA